MTRVSKVKNLLLLIATVAFSCCAPAWSQATDQAIYSDNLQNGWENYGWATINYAATSPVHTGSDSIAVTVGAWQAIFIHHTAFDSTPYQSLSFWIHGGTSGGQRLRIQAELSGQAQTAVTIGPITANTWQQITIPLASLGVASHPDLDGFWIQDTTGGSQPTFYLDDITLYATNVPVPTSAHLMVNASTPVRTVDSRIFGVNTAVWNSGLGNPGTLALLAASQTGSLRYPGGSTSDAYDWSTDRSDGGTSQWAASFPVFANLASTLGTQTYLTVDYGSGTPQMAAAWVAYANGAPGNTTVIGIDAKGRDWKTVGYWASMRAAQPLSTDDGYNFLRVNHPAGYGFKYWEIGNECYGSWENDQHGVSGSGLTGVVHDAYTYATYAQQFIQQMKSVDPTIKIGTVGIVGEDDWGNSTHGVSNPNENNTSHSGWTPVALTTLKSLGTLPDFLIYHRYAQGPGSESDSVLLQASTGWKTDAATLRKIITDYVGNGGVNIELAATETNSVSYNPGKQTTSLVNGLFRADTLGSLAQTEFNACQWWNLYNGSQYYNNDGGLYGWRQFGDYGILASGDRGDTPFNTPYPSYYAGKLVTNWAHNGDQVVGSSSDYNLLSCYAVKQQNGSLALLVINKSPTTDLTGHISLSGFIPGSSTATVIQYGKEEDSANADLTQTTLSNVGTAFDGLFPSYSMSVIVLAPAIATPIPSVPTSLTATSLSDSQINLAWTAGSGAASYTISRSATHNGPYTQIGTATGTTYSDSNLIANTAYYYVVSASNSAGQSANSTEASANTKQDVPSAPTGLTATATSTTQINLIWNSVSSATGYTIFRATTHGGPYTQIGTATGTSYGDTGLTAITAYYYVISATNTVGQSAYSTEASATTKQNVPNAPSGLTATPTNTSQINLAWSAVPTATSYTVFRSITHGGPYTQVGTATGTSYGDTGLTANTTYYYVISAANSAGSGSRSTEVSATTLSNIVPHVGQTISLYAFNNKFVCADLNRTKPTLIANRTAVGTWEKFRVDNAGNGNICLFALANNQYVTATATTPLIANQVSISNATPFRWEYVSSGKVALRMVVNSQAAKYVCADQNRTGSNPPELIANRNAIGSWETFTWASY